MTADGGVPVEIVDTTTRDGNQSLWGATGLTARETLAIAVAQARAKNIRLGDTPGARHPHPQREGVGAGLDTRARVG